MASGIRIAKKEDADRVTLLLKKLKKDYRRGKFTKRCVEGKMASGKDFFVLSGKGMTRRSIVNKDIAEFRFLVKGDEKLVRFSLNSLKRKNIRKVLARFRSDDTESLSLFTKTGFLPEGYFKEHYRRKVDIVQLCKFLR